MRFFFALLWPLALSQPVFAALPSNAGRAVTFYREKNSPFASGQASRNTLLDRLVQTDVELQYHCRWNGRDYILQSSQILTELNVAQFVDARASLQLLSLPRADASAISRVPARQKFEVVNVENPWVRVRDLKTKSEGWVLSSQVKSRHDDLGFFSNLIRTPLRAEGLHSSSILTYIPSGARLKPLAIDKDFIKIQYKNFVGFADITHFVSRADFATLAFHPAKKWQAVKHRVGAQIITKQNQELDLKDMRGYLTSSQRAIVFQPDNSYGPPLQAHVEIIRPKAFIWAQSRVTGHGLIWWKKEDLKLQDDTKISDQHLTTDELMKRPIYEIALEGKESLRGLVSSDGIYRTEDGLNWSKIELFGKERLPITIHSNGNWFVGSFRSQDRGKTFEPFIRWDRIALAIESSYNRNPRFLRLNKIESLPNSRLAISIDTGNMQEVKLQTLIGDFQWSVIRR